MLCDNSKRKNIHGVFSRHLFRFQELTNPLTAISPKAANSILLTRDDPRQTPGAYEIAVGGKNRHTQQTLTSPPISFIPAKATVRRIGIFQ